MPRIEIDPQLVERYVMELAAFGAVGATGVAQIFEIWLQLRGEAGERQVAGARAGLTENGGGMVRGEAAATTVHILAI